jgi:hypothetical protein
VADGVVDDFSSYQNLDTPEVLAMIFTLAFTLMTLTSSNSTGNRVVQLSIVLGLRDWIKETTPVVTVVD